MANSINNDTSSVLHPAFSAALETDRELFNQQFKWYCTNGSLIDKPTFYDHLRNRLSNIVGAVATDFPERVRPVTQELYLASLELFRAQFFGKESKLRELGILWDETLPTIPHLIAREPKRTVGILSNALINISQNKNTRTNQWLADIKRIAKHCQSATELSETCVVLAWLSGVAILRSNALDSLRKMPAHLAKQIVAPNSSAPSIDMMNLVASLENNPWCSLTPAESVTPTGSVTAVKSAISREQRLTIAHTVGAFTGFGGNFSAPPKVFLDENRIFAFDEQGLWRLFVDRFGWTLHRCSETVLTKQIPRYSKSGAKHSGNKDMYIENDGTVHAESSTVRLAHIAFASSQASDGHSLAVTLPTSFHVFVVATVPSYDEMSTRANSNSSGPLVT